MMQVGSFVHLGCVDLDEMGTVDEDEVPHHTVNMRSTYIYWRFLDNYIVSNNFAVVTAFIIVIVVVVLHQHDI